MAVFSCELGARQMPAVSGHYTLPSSTDTAICYTTQLYSTQLCWTTQSQVRSLQLLPDRRKATSWSRNTFEF